MCSQQHRGRKARHPFEFLTAPEWHPQTLCGDLDAETADRVFFPGMGGHGAVAARSMFASCSVRDACLTWALENPESAEFGVWGGTSPEERRKLKRRAS
jgi:WhiB family redox-sensing transcriptional regulator